MKSYRVRVLKYRTEHEILNPRRDVANVGDWVVSVGWVAMYRLDTWEEAMKYAMAIRDFLNAYVLDNEE